VNLFRDIRLIRQYSGTELLGELGRPCEPNIGKRAAEEIAVTEPGSTAREETTPLSDHEVSDA
jgi:hypothetical protein